MWEFLKELISEIFKKPTYRPIMNTDAPVPPAIAPVSPVVTNNDLISISQFPPKIVAWAKGIQNEEGIAHPNGSLDRNLKNNNPGNIRATKYGLSLGLTIGIDHDGIPMGDKGFCVYKSYEIGFNALCQLLHDAASSELISYKGSMPLWQFTEIYAEPPQDSHYAQNVANAIGCSVDTAIKQMLIS